ncbi:twin-arginine translocase subunit TatC [Geovibrio thiophilus]|uniref:Sec-independent protein translocase protein TatC n=1 Tax=Geovibrio thiophilus TaxID=139438 RepID=A0A410JV52_9BACT|nr:twin-arginine translocase subunit TatC [Geovibrio thiophilus]QAR32064.1 twin-arginine translocase subunit TatC [Geovibrio thiophilus]
MAKEKNQGVEAQIPLMEHLEELRKRVIYVLIIVIAVFSFCYWQSQFFMDFVTKPLVDVMPEKSSMAMLKITEGFFMELKLCFMAALFFSMPFIFYHIWKFIAPGLYVHEKKYVMGFVISASLLFFLGAGFAYYFVFPFGFAFFLKYAQGYVIANLSIEWYLSFVTKMVLGFGIVFELPVFTFFLAKMGIITAEMMRKYRRYAVLGIFIVAAVMTPPDVFSQLMMAGPLLVLYELSIFIAVIFGRKREITEDEIYE